MDKEKGYVYILTNPSFREDWIKIGKSSRPVNIRSKELDNTAVPLPFEIYATLKTTRYNEVEKNIHHQIDRLTDLRIRKTREFFNVKPNVALEILRDIAAMLDDAEIKTCFDKCDEIPEKEQINEIKPQKTDIKKKRPPFKFSMINIKVGESLIFTPTGFEVKVASDNKIEYQGKEYKLSPFVRYFMPANMLTTSGAYQGAKFFTYNGKILDDIRTENETEKE